MPHGHVFALRIVAAIALIAAAPAARAAAQTPTPQALAQRIRAAGNGTVELQYSARTGACGDGRHWFSFGGGSRFGSFNSDDAHGMSECVPGPVRTRLRIADGVVSDLSVTVGGPPSREPPSTSLGPVPSAVAAEYFLQLAESASGDVARGAITAAVLADSATVWSRLLRIAGDTATRSRPVRHEALFWVGRFAAAKSAGRAEDLSSTEDDGNDRDDPRGAAVFALSQLRNHEGIPPLLQIARSHREPAIRRKALFWLGESGDPRAVGLFQEILRR